MLSELQVKLIKFNILTETIIGELTESMPVDKRLDIADRVFAQIELNDFASWGEFRDRTDWSAVYQKTRPFYSRALQQFSAFLA